jgi:hypothetical protein
MIILEWSQGRGDRHCLRGFGAEQISISLPSLLRREHHLPLRIRADLFSGHAGMVV